MPDGDLTIKELAAEVASNLLENNHFVTLQDTEEILRYEDGVYEEGGEAYIKKKIEENLAKPEITTSLVNEVIGHVKRSTLNKRSVFEEQNPHLVLQNCLLNLDTLEKEDFRPAYYALNKLPTIYDPKAICPKIERFLSQVVYSDDIPTIQEYCGYVLWRGYPAAKALLLIGEGGNGKSTFIRLILAMLGIKNTSSRSLQSLENNRFALADLYGKMANLFADLPDIALKSDGTFKMLTGGDPITAEKKFQGSFNFINAAKLIFSTNKPPEVIDDTRAFFRRWILITFPNIFEGKNNENKSLIDELTTPEELSGFLNWCLEGLKRLRGNNWNFTNSRSADDIREEYIRKSSPVKAFFMDCVIENFDSFAVKKEAYKQFAEYCMSEKLPVVSEATFFKTIPAILGSNFREQRTDVNADGKRENVFVGFCVREPSKWKTEKDISAEANHLSKSSTEQTTTA